MSIQGLGTPAHTPGHLDRPGSGVQAHVGAGIQGWAHMGGQEVLSCLHREENHPGHLKRSGSGGEHGMLGPGLGLSWEGYGKAHADGSGKVGCHNGQGPLCLGHSSTQAPGLLGGAPTQGPLNRHVLTPPPLNFQAFLN